MSISCFSETRENSFSPVTGFTLQAERREATMRVNKREKRYIIGSPVVVSGGVDIDSVRGRPQTKGSADLEVFYG